MSSLGVLKDRIETLPTLVLRDVQLKSDQGEYSRVDPSLLSHVDIAFSQDWPGISAEYGRYPDSLIHGDCHYGNIFLTPEGGICLIDWGSACIAPGLMDLTALVDVSQRMGKHQIHETELLGAYFCELPQPDKQAYGSPDRAWTVCRTVRSLLELEWFATTGEDYGQRVQRELTLLHRFHGLLIG